MGLLPQPKINVVLSRTVFGFSTATFFFYLAVVGLGAFILWSALIELPLNLLPVLLLWTVFCTVVEMKPVMVTKSMVITVSFAIHLSAIILWGNPIAIVSATVGSFLTDLFRARGIKKAVYNAAQYSIAIWTAGVLFSFFRKSNVTIDINQDFLALFFACTTYMLINTFLVAAIGALTQKKPVIYSWTKDLGLDLFQFVTLAPLGIITAMLYERDPYAIALLVIPLIMTHISFQNYANLVHQSQETIEMLALALDKRDPYTSHHSSQVASLATKIASEMHLKPSEIDAISMGGRVHDLGKISIPDSILNKPSPLTADEYARVKQHPKDGYDLLSGLHFYRKVLSFVLYHHERVDGKGYPDGLKSESIPLGAKIISVADAYDAMTSHRPYRDAMSCEQAIAELVKNSGTQFDPSVVEAAVRIILPSCQDAESPPSETK